jgi:hypothetical protein
MRNELNELAKAARRCHQDLAERFSDRFEREVRAVAALNQLNDHRLEAGGLDVRLKAA